MLRYIFMARYMNIQVVHDVSAEKLFLRDLVAAGAVTDLTGALWVSMAETDNSLNSTYTPLSLSLAFFLSLWACMESSTLCPAGRIQHSVGLTFKNAHSLQGWLTSEQIKLWRLDKQMIAEANSLISFTRCNQ